MTELRQVYQVSSGPKVANVGAIDEAILPRDPEKAAVETVDPRDAEIAGLRESLAEEQQQNEQLHELVACQLGQLAERDERITRQDRALVDAGTTIANLTLENQILRSKIGQMRGDNP